MTPVDHQDEHPPLPTKPHIPVLLEEVLMALEPRAGETYIDGTFGAGGYSTAILDAAACHVLALDRDVTAVRAADAVTARYPNRLTVVEAPFSTLDDVSRVYLSTDKTETAASVFSPPSGVVLDIGVSSMQLDQPARGFSFQTDGPLDMRMSQGGTFAGPSAADVVNSASADDLADIFFHLGDERRARQIARAIVMDRDAEPFTHTLQLADLVSRILKTKKIDGRHAATRVFQALRIYVNDELGELVLALSAAERILPPGGRLVVVSFHSLEDSIVKKFFRARTGREAKGSRHGPLSSAPSVSPSFQFVNHRPVNPSETEIARNPRSRSARLRSAVRTEHAVWDISADDLAFPRLTT
jgi:16S rRNA (cytosine1402-N4)-methyltransferase